MSRLVVSIHDVAAATADASRIWLDRLDGIGIPVVLKVVPGPYLDRPLASAPTLVSDLVAAAGRGHEVCLHGWCHRAEPGTGLRARLGRVVARGAEEFWSLDPIRAERRVRRGLFALRDCGLEPAGFTPPGWLAPRATRDVLAGIGLQWTTDHCGVSDLGEHRRIPATAWCYRGGATETNVGAAVVRRAVRRSARWGGVVRFAVHPVDTEDRWLVDATVELIRDLIEEGAEPTTFGALTAP